MSDIRRGFADAVRSERQKQRLSQEEFADRAGVHRTYVSEVERGLRNISLDNIERFASALHLPVSDLFRIAEKRERT